MPTQPAKETHQKVALVTGASSGIGFAITEQLALHGYKVYACARRIDLIKPLVEQFSSEKVVAVNLDISQPSEIVALKERLTTELSEGKLDILYNNAGQSCTFAALDVTDEAMEQCFKVNVFGHINMCRELSQFLINAQGTILFTGSIAGFMQFPFGSVYSASKAAIHSFAHVLHLEMKPFGVRVINVVTGGVDTDIGDKRPLPDSSVFNFPEGKEAFLYRQTMVKQHHPMSPEEYAKKVMTDILSKNDPVDVYRGSMATIMHYVNMVAPYWLLEWGIYRRFKFGNLIKVLKTKLKRD